MPHYFYLGASLPSLKRDEASPLSVEAFLELCSKWVDPARLELLSKLGAVPSAEGAIPKACASTHEFLAWERALRSRLARQRAGKLGRTELPSEDSAASDAYFVEFERLVQEVYAAPNPLERERLLDAARWRKLEDLELGHIFDFDNLCIYKLRLMLREKWSARQVQKGSANLDRAVDSIQQAAAAAKNESSN